MSELLLKRQSMPHRKATIVFAALLAAALSWGKAQAEDYPTKPITMVVAFAAGTGTDSAARFMAEGIRKETGQPVIIENKPGANGAIAAAAVAKARKDGYTILVSTQTTHAANLALYKSLPYDPVNDFVPVTTFFRSPMVLVARPSFPANSVTELVALAKTNPGKYTFAHANGAARAGGEYFKMLAKVDLVNIPYNAAPQAITDMVGERVDMMWADGFTSMPMVRAGKLKALGVTSATRIDSVPGVPTIAEQGVTGYELQGWVAVWAPAGTPAPVVARLADLIGRYAQDNPGWFAPVVSQMYLLTGKEFANFQSSEIRKWGDIMRNAGVEPE
jgi:tripartite-type tricarboxylate transporter receptor subunit TctC